MRSIAIACTLAATTALAADFTIPGVATVRVLKVTRLDDMAALEKLRTSNPDHYGRAVEILRVASEESCETADAYAAHVAVAPKEKLMPAKAGEPKRR